MRRSTGGLLLALLTACSGGSDGTTPTEPDPTTIVLTRNEFSMSPSHVRNFDVAVPGRGTVRVVVVHSYREARVAVVATGTTCVDADLAFNGQCAPQHGSTVNDGSSNRRVVEFVLPAAATVRVWLANQDASLSESGNLEVTYTR